MSVKTWLSRPLPLHDCPETSQLMDRRNVIRLLGGSALVYPVTSFAQSPAKVRRVGLLSPGAAIGDKSPIGAALIKGLAEHGYEMGKNLAFERRGAEGHVDRLPQFIDQLVANNVDVVVTTGYPTALAAKQGTTVPIVAVNAGDPIATGLVTNLARPGGNLTGISDVSAEVTPKRLEFLNQLAPTLLRVAIFCNPHDFAMTSP